MNESNFSEATLHAYQAHEAVQGVCRATMLPDGFTPRHAAEQLGFLAAMTAAFPQAFSQLAGGLDHISNQPGLTMDGMTEETDPIAALGVAQLYLLEARQLAVEMYKLLDNAHQATAHVRMTGETS